MLLNRVTGEEREVDFVIRGRAAGHEVVVGVEASGRRRKASAEWFEQMIGKHKNLPTDKVVLVAEAGFADQARQLAESEGVVAVAAEDLSSGDPAYVVVNRLRSIWPKTVSLSPERVRVFVRRPGEENVVWFKALPDHVVYFEDGEEFGALIQVLQALIRTKSPRLADASLCRMRPVAA